LLIIGAVTDLLSVPAVLLIIAAGIASIAVVSVWVSRLEDADEGQHGPPRQPQEAGVRGGGAGSGPRNARA
jgi:hypothetical protein